MKKQQLKSWTYALFIGAVLVSCEDDPAPKEVAESNGSAYILNEGNFGSGNGDLSIYNLDNKSVSNNVVAANNGEAAGDVAQSLTFANNKTYLVLNNDAKVVVLDANNKIVNTIAGSEITFPRHAVTFSNKVYVTDGSGNVVVIDASTDQILSTIAVGVSPERLFVNDDKLYVCNSGGFATPGDTVNIPKGSLSVIDLNNNSLITTTNLESGTKDLVIDNSGFVWVLSIGATVYNSDYSEILKSTPAYLSKLDLNGNLLSQAQFDASVGKPSGIELLSGTKLVYVSGNVSEINDDAEVVNNLISGKFAYGFNVGPNNNIWLCDAKDFIQQGEVYIYDANGSVSDSIEVGIIPNGVYFK